MGNDIKQWIEIDPLDTLFLRGSEPMVAGQNHEVRSVFPPMPSTILGALRTAILTQRGVDLAEFIKDEESSPVVASLPLLGSAEKSGFAVAGPLIEAEIAGGAREIFLPSPAYWFGGANKNKNIMSVCTAKAGLDETATIGLVGGSPFPLLVEVPQSTGMKNLYGFWANAAAFSAVAKGDCQLEIVDDIRILKAGKPALLQPDALFGREQRTGIALDLSSRRVRKGHLYTSTHVRLVSGARLLVALSAELVPSHLDSEGLLQLGGEQRLSRYRLRKGKVSLPVTATGWAMTLAPIEFRALRQTRLLDRPRASGPLLRMAGWDMKKQFHKPTVAYLPIGTVIEPGDVSDSLPFGFIAI
jgi:CRISPR-associated protein Cmr3